jgi:hypothetical protein
MSSGRRVVAIGDESRIQEALPNLPSDTWLLVRERVGHRAMMLISNDPWGTDAPLVKTVLGPSQEAKP